MIITQEQFLHDLKISLIERDIHEKKVEFYHGEITEHNLKIQIDLLYRKYGL